jgi:hypothetical protein
MFINARYDTIKQKYVWPSTGEPVTQYPPTYNYFYDHYSGNTYTWRTTPIWNLNFADSKSYFQSYSNTKKAKSILCFKKNFSL